MSLLLYDQDFYAWAQTQADLLRQGRLADADIGHIAEEIESMGRAEKRELVSRLTVLLLHLLKWRFQPDQRGRSWRLSIIEQRLRITDHLADNPSLKARLPEALAAAHRLARLEAARETGLELDMFPDTCPWTFPEIMEEDFWPQG